MTQEDVARDYVSPYIAFVFERYGFDKKSKTLTLTYSLDGKIFFDDTFVFDFPFAQTLNHELLERAFFNLFVMAGISYFKAYIPPHFEFKTGELCKEQQDFFTKVYTLGLGEFFIKNQINPNKRIYFKTTSDCLTPIDAPDLSGALVSLGGGKDSLVTVELFQRAGLAFDTWNLTRHASFDRMVATIGEEHLVVEHQISPKLLELNKQDALNGHIPISAIWAFTGICMAILRGKADVVVSNEYSASIGSTTYFGMEINHQYSKSLEFEQDFQNYVARFISPSIHYFSFLRPLTELKIAEVFGKHFFAKYAGIFSSCNKNFTGSNTRTEFFWCGTCAKCAFVFAILAPFVPKDDLIRTFGKNLFDDPTLDTTFAELLGLSGIKPFDCVGEPDEVRHALRLAQASGEWPELARFSIPEPNSDHSTRFDHSMPAKYSKILFDFLDHGEETKL